MSNTERSPQLVRGGRLHLARRPVPRAAAVRQPAELITRQARRRGHHQPDDLRGARWPTARPTTSRSRELAARGAAVDDRRPRDHHRRRARRRDVFRDVWTPPAASTAGSRSRSTRGWPTTPRRPSPRRGPVEGRRPAQPDGQDPGHRGGPARRSPATLAEGISVNVTLIFSVERYRAGHGRLPRRAGAGQGQRPRPAQHQSRWRRSSSPASTPRSTSGWRRSAPTRRWPCAARPPSPTPASPTPPSRRCSPASAGRRSSRPAPSRSARCGRPPA